jgi:hypothetical protein
MLKVRKGLHLKSTPALGLSLTAISSNVTCCSIVKHMYSTVAEVAALKLWIEAYFQVHPACDESIRVALVFNPERGCVNSPAVGALAYPGKERKMIFNPNRGCGLFD